MSTFTRFRTWGVLILRLALGVIFLVSGPPKLAYPDLFASNVMEYEMLGPTLSVAMAAVLPAAEIILGICLVARIAVGGAFLFAGMLMVVFTIAQSWVLAHGGIVSCSCFSLDHSDIIRGITIWRDVGLLSMAALGLLLSMEKKGPASRDMPAMEPSEIEAAANA